jgi:peptide-methionine (S)-S-oxide reductase
MEPQQPKKESKADNREVITLGGGCFWCTEAVYSMVQGVVKVESGYAGGCIENPNYEQVSTGKTGHAEVVQVTFDPSVVSLREILKIFFAAHNPTTLNRQGADVGTQYRSVVFYHSDAQRETVERLIEELNYEKIWSAPIVTQITPLKAFYRAEGYHRNYYEQHRNQPYCRLVIDPKLKKLRKRFKDHLKKAS